MAKQQIYQLRPYGWENDPEEEKFKVSTLDYLTAQVYCNYAVFFRLSDEEKPRVVEILKAGLERTLAQARHMNGSIEKDPKGGHSFTKRKDSIVAFHVQWLDDPSDAKKYPSFDDIHQANYNAVILGDQRLWSVPPMTYGEKPEAYPDNSPVTSAFKANFVRGGLVFNMHHHHYANDVMGWAGFTHQLAENCYAIVHRTPFPSWDPACNDLSRLTKPDPPEELRVSGRPPPERHPGHKGGVDLLYHLPKSKASKLKELAKPKDGTWISTYDAFAAFLWRHTVREKATMNIRIDSFPPMSILHTDCRDANIVSADFGFGKPSGYRHSMDQVTEGVVVIYPPRDPSPESDEGPEFAISFEKDLAHLLLGDPEFNEYFEYRGVDSE
ncbi:Trichothecene 3-O-acetyltransferase TRI101 [Colletotrichum sp. SAR11_59]|nr:Trichothecene 3-O-acetyltransferase TRI101 [Colletotrichum sp. SAR11_59]